MKWKWLHSNSCWQRTQSGSSNELLRLEIYHIVCVHFLQNRFHEVSASNRALCFVLCKCRRAVLSHAQRSCWIYHSFDFSPAATAVAVVVVAIILRTSNSTIWTFNYVAKSFIKFSNEVESLYSYTSNSILKSKAHTPTELCMKKKRQWKEKENVCVCVCAESIMNLWSKVIRCLLLHVFQAFMKSVVL